MKQEPNHKKKIVFDCFRNINLKEVNLPKKFENSRKAIDNIATMICPKKDETHVQKPKGSSLKWMRKKLSTLLPQIAAQGRSSFRFLLKARSSLKMNDENFQESLLNSLREQGILTNKENGLALLNKFISQTIISKQVSPAPDSSSGGSPAQHLISRQSFLRKNTDMKPLDTPSKDNKKKFIFKLNLNTLVKKDSKEEPSAFSNKDPMLTVTNANNNSTLNSTLSRDNWKDLGKTARTEFLNTTRSRLNLSRNLKAIVDENCKSKIESVEKENNNIRSKILKLNDEYKHEDPIKKEFERDKKEMGEGLKFDKGFVIYGKKMNNVHFMKENQTIFRLTTGATKIGETQAYLYKDLLFDKFAIKQDNKNPNLINFKIKRKGTDGKIDKFLLVESMIKNTRLNEREAMFNLNKFIQEQQQSRIRFKTAGK